MRFLSGVYRLIWQRVLNADGRITYPRGDDAIGQLIYTVPGTMSVHLLRLSDYTSELHDLESEVGALRGTLAYSGTYTINDDEKTVTHHLQTCTYPHWVGQDLVRQYAFEQAHDGEVRLTLTAHYKGEKRVLLWEAI